ncbi:MAG: hypothetical protein FWF35_04130 [Elusimicrobia bacterium]|nr:hypothetical protein [Elusimicrobiota bacterium]
MTKEIFIKTRLFKNNSDFIEQRKKLIQEAISFKSGNQTQREKTITSVFGCNKAACFSKPGKEAARKNNPNLLDMYPSVEENEKELFQSWAFQQIWEYLIKISIIQHDAFKKVLVLLYRLCFFIDHKENTAHQFRYAPSNEVLNEIENIQKYVLIPGFKERFGTTQEVELLDFLYFVDLLSWNEDVKYRTKKEPGEFFKKNKNGTYSLSTGECWAGRVNTILSIISAPLMISKFIDNIIYATANKGTIDVRLITTTIQTFAKTRGICVIHDRELLAYLSPYLEDNK